MKISHRWLREFVETDWPPREIADRLVNAGNEVAIVEPVVEGLSGVVIGEIEAIEQDLGESRPGHLNRLCRVAIPDRKLSVICGASPAHLSIPSRSRRKVARRDSGVSRYASPRLARVLASA